MKLTPAAIADIRRRRADGEKLIVLALDYGVSEMAVSLAARGVTHRPRAPHPRHRPVEGKIVAALRSHADGLHVAQLAGAIYGDTSQTCRARVSVNIHGLKCRGLVRRVGVGVWALTEAA